MRIQIENTDQMIHDLATTIRTDPPSVEAWQCQHINIAEHTPEGLPINQLASLAKQYQGSFKDCDADVIFCKDGDVLVISKTISNHDMHVLAIDICRVLNLPNHIEVTHYDLSTHWREVHTLLHKKVASLPIQLNALLDDAAEIHSFGEIDALQEVFESVKQTRQGRNPMHILLVEDDKVTRRLVSNVFKEDFAVITAESAEDAITNYLLYAPDIVFLDINLPDTNGFSVLKQIIALDKDAYVIMFSGNSYLDNVTHALTQGASGFVAKPFKREKLTHYIHAYAEQHHKHLM